MKRFTTLFVIGCMLASCAAVNAAGISVSTTRGSDANLKIECPGINLTETTVLGAKAYAITAPDASVASDKDAPALPLYTAMVVVDPVARPTFKVTSLKSEIINIDARIMPSKGNFVRTIDPESVPFNYGQAYNEDKWYPSDKDMVKMGKPFIFRSIRGVNLVVSPVQYNPVKNQLKLHKELSVVISSTKGASSNTIKKAKISSGKDFEAIYRKAFINYQPSRLDNLNDNGRLLIIVHDPFMKAIKPFVEWKQKLGFKVKVMPMSEVGTTNTDVKAAIQEEFNLGGMTHVMLVGDSDQIPTNKGVKERADSDPCYVKLAGDDHVPDAIISRLSANTEEEVAYQVAKFINYEEFPTEDPSWYTRLLGIGSDQGRPADYQYIDEIRTTLLGKMFKEAEKAYDPGARASMVTDAVNKGVSLINYLGHGSGTSWGTTRFSNSSMKTLNNGWKMPIIFDVACLNGKFVNTTGFGEAWMRTGSIEAPAGAVTYAGSTTSMEWVPPIKVQAEFNKNFIANETYKSIGGIFINGIIKGLELYTADPYRSGVMMFEQWHIFGDGTLQVRFKAPAKVKTTNRAVRSEGSVQVSVNVVNEEGKPVNGACVTVYTEGVKDLQMAFTNSKGQAVVDMPENTKAGYVTVSSADIVPVVDQPIAF